VAIVTVLASIVLAGLGTYCSRALFIVALAKRRIPPNISLAMDYVGPSVLAALVVTLLATPEGEVAIGAAEASALTVAALLAWRTRNHLLTVSVAMLVFWGVRALLAAPWP
jgi:branched-subunit amino acid transport protein